MPTSLAHETVAGPAAPGCTCFRLRSLSRVVTQIYDHALAPYGLTITKMGNFDLNLAPEDLDRLKKFANDVAYTQLAGNRVILVVIFDARSSLGLVRLRVKRACEELTHIFDSLLKKTAEPGTDSPFAEITDEDIDNLFND